jgi:hypothetical protein
MDGSNNWFYLGGDILGTMVAALFVRKDSIYKELGLDCWGEERKAENYKGPYPVICHPPCQQWGRLRQFAKVNEYEKNLAFIAIDLVRKYGGVLEHPEASKLFDGKILPLPGQRDKFGFSMKICQNWFGHKARKKTYLYIVGIEPKNIPAYPISFDLPQVQNLRNLSKKYREYTPVKFAKWLKDLAERCAA